MLLLMCIYNQEAMVLFVSWLLQINVLIALQHSALFSCNHVQAPRTLRAYLLSDF